MPVVGKTAAIYDTGTTQFVGDPDSIKRFFEPLELFYGAQYAPQYGAGIYTSTSTSLVLLLIRPHNTFYLSQSHATLTLPSPFLLKGRKSRFPPIRLTWARSRQAVIRALPERPGMTHSRVVSWPLITFMGLGIKLTLVQNFGLSVTFSCGTFTLLGMSATRALVLLTFADLA
jgi:hypothetical protein